ncbi:hypothetical protein A7985_19070 [Pseudoalteromonas luteoviolacea]|uniref:Uncharacterized protein n=1 Tax=Pseudoalteromonas luteoviolacea TaxID=43657 RepID=A0A1C0TM96_9GAMM|nr:spondin domain-containing protein [Pseudoalteromonas luteoviolacea]MBQ4812256.1 spondin domain-containing protein [Pseudoalteromonas luteoviolacea]OCQ19996.1 hypothetical protein A7985_19070 [Pseudoalteromonas luteoviolacea]
MKLSKLIIPLACLTLVACGDDDDPPMTVDPTPTPTEAMIKITATNLTYAQPLSPIGVALHKEGQFWQLGEPASEALEVLAEGGDNSGLLGLDVVQTKASTDAPLAPGAKAELTLSQETLADQKLSVITMMVNTNDGFTGLNALDVSSMAVGEEMRFVTYAYDAGTEANTEASGTIPGPADGGEGFNAQRETLNKVAMHPGVVGQDDGLSSSVLSSDHKFDNPLMAITITRMK